MAAWYVGSTKWTAVTAWAALTSYSVGDLRRQLATPTVLNERVFRCTTAGTSGAAEPTWTITVGGTTADGTAVWTEVTGQSTYNEGGTPWGAPHARLNPALATGWAAAGDTIYLSDNHAETQASAMALTSPGTAASPVRIICVDDAAGPPTAKATTGIVTTTGNSSISFAGFADYYGLTFNCGTTAGGANINFASTAASWHRLTACALRLINTAVGNRIVLGPAGGNIDDFGVECVNTTVQFAATAQAILLRCPFRWWGTATAVTGATIPTSLFVFGNTTPGQGEVTGVDLSALGSGKNLADVSVATTTTLRFSDCNLGSSVAITTGTHPGQGGMRVGLINCDSADTNYRYYRQVYQGTETQETTVVRTGGASDGTTTLGRKIVTTANSKIYSPYEAGWMSLWNETLSSQTFTVEIVTDNVTLTDAEAWLEIEYLGTSGLPLGVFASDSVADDVFGTPANQTSSSETWTTTGLGTPVKQKLAVTVTPAEKGPIRCRVCVAKASTTVYYDPKVVVS